MPELSAQVEPRDRSTSTQLDSNGGDHLGGNAEQDHLMEHANMLQQILSLPESDAMILQMLEDDMALQNSRMDDQDSDQDSDQGQNQASNEDTLAQLQERNQALNPKAQLLTSVPSEPNLEDAGDFIGPQQETPSEEELEARQKQLGTNYDKDNDVELMEMRSQQLRPGLTTEDILVLEDKLLELERMDIKWDYKTVAAAMNYEDNEDFVIAQARALRRGLPPLAPQTEAQLRDQSELPEDLKPKDDLDALASLDDAGAKESDLRERLTSLQDTLPEGQDHRDEVEDAEYQVLAQEAGMAPPPLDRQSSIEIIDDDTAQQKARQNAQQNGHIYNKVNRAARGGGLNKGLDIMKESRGKKLKRYLTSKGTYSEMAKSKVPGYTTAKNVRKAKKEVGRIHAAESLAKGTENNELLQAVLACGLFYQRYKRDKASINAAASLPTPGAGLLGAGIKSGIKAVGGTADYWARYLKAGKGQPKGSYQTNKLAGKGGAKIGDLRDMRNLRALLYSAGSGSMNPNMQAVAQALGSQGEDLSKRAPAKGDHKKLNGSQDDYLSFAERNVYQDLKDGKISGDQVPPQMILPILWRMHKIFTTVARYKAEQEAAQDKALEKHNKAVAKAQKARAQGKKVAIPRMNRLANQALRRKQADAAADVDDTPMASLANTPSLSPNQDQSLKDLEPETGFLAHAKQLDTMPEHQPLPLSEENQGFVTKTEEKKKEKQKKQVLLA